MKKLLGISLIALSSISYAENSQMSENLTLGLGYSMDQFDVDGGENLDLSGLQLRISKEINENLAVRFDYLIGMGDDAVDLEDGDSLDLELSSAFSLFIQPQIALNEKVNAYGLVGFTRGTFESTLNNVSGFFDESAEGTEEESDSSISFGLGINGNIQDNIGVYAEYVSYLREDDYDFTGINLGATLSF